MSDERAEHARRVAGSLAAALRQQQELGVAGVPVDVARRLHEWVRDAPALLARDAPAAAAPVRQATNTPEIGRGSSPNHAADVGSGSVATTKPNHAPVRPALDARTPQPVSAAEPSRAPEREPEVPSAPADYRSPEPPAPRPVARGSARPPYARQGSAGSSLGLGSPALEEIRGELGDCERCCLCKRRSNIVFGVGNPSARLMFIGDAPGEREDSRGEPFVGAAGELLTKMIGAMGLSRSDVYIANVIKCRPPANRDPAKDEVASCLPFLKRQVVAVAPEVIVTLGRIAPEALLARDILIAEERGTWTEFEGVPTMLTLHPEFLLQEPAAKRDAWGDLQQVMKRLGLARR
ncbi:MAG: uracil-DNA glycosylase family 4 [Bradymonadia bacterium]|jgi:uracil-DNA glycosylase family 4